MKYKVAELTGALLDAAVVKAENNFDIEWIDGAPYFYARAGHERYNERERVFFEPSADWEDGGPIIEREWASIRNALEALHDGIYWPRSIALASPNTLQTFMRAYVFSRLGSEVEL